MEKRIKAYYKYLTSLDRNTMAKEEVSDLANNILIQINFFQHERLIHLLVTALFSIFFILSFINAYTCFSLLGLLLFIIITIVEIFYVKHYYYLENYIQKMYLEYDRLIDQNYYNNK